MKPMMALSGVRSSWLMLARNCDLCWLATSSSRPFASISWNSRAFWIASTDWAAKVWSSCHDLGEKGSRARAAGRPGRRGADPRARAARRGATACPRGRAGPGSAEPRAASPSRCRQPGRARGSRRPGRPPLRRAGPAPSGARLSSSGSPGRWPARGSSGEPRRTRRRCRRRCRRAGPRRLTMVASTVSRSSVELTAWPTSPSARSSPTDRVRSPVRASSSWNSRTFSMAMTAWSAKVLSELDLPSEKARH